MRLGEGTGGSVLVVDSIARRQEECGQELHVIKVKRAVNCVGGGANQVTTDGGHLPFSHQHQDNSMTVDRVPGFFDQCPLNTVSVG